MHPFPANDREEENFGRKLPLRGAICSVKRSKKVSQVKMQQDSVWKKIQRFILSALNNLPK